jgi:hypothetical protein
MKNNNSMTKTTHLLTLLLFGLFACKQKDKELHIPLKADTHSGN